MNILVNLSTLELRLAPCFNFYVIRQCVSYFGWIEKYQPYPNHICYNKKEL